MSELRRRNVFRMAALYVVAAWLVMQVAEVLIGLANLPAWIGPTTLALLGIGFPIALILSWFYELTPAGISRDGESKTTELSNTGRRVDFIVIALLVAGLLLFAWDKWLADGPPVRSLAVLPFAGLGTDAEFGYLADVMTVELNNELGRIESLSIRSRKSADRYRVADKLLPQIADELKVDALVEGSIQRIEDELRINLQLVDGRTDQQLWSEVFLSDVGDFLTVQGQVARAIADQIEIELTPETEARLSRDRRTSPQAIRLLAIGNHLLMELDPVSFERALAAFNEAVTLDAELADAYVGIGHAYLFLSGWYGSKRTATMLPLAKSAANKAVHLDPDLADGHFLQAEVLRLEWKWQEAENAFERGRGLNPNGSIGLMEFANFLTALGRCNEAVQIAREVVEIDPLSPTSHNELGFALMCDGQIDAALEQYQESLQLDPVFVQTHLLLADLYLHSGRFDEAIPHLKRQRDAIASQSWISHALLGLQYGLVGLRDDAKDTLSLLETATESEHVPAMAFAYLHLGLEEHDQAIDWLETAYEERDLSLVWLKHLWIFDVLREDPRFQGLVAKMGFPD